MRAALIVDVDGVVSPVHGATAWGDDVDGGMRHTPVSPLLNGRLDALGDRPDVLPMWLTSWGSEMRSGMRFPGADWPALAHQWPWSGPPVYDAAAARKRAGDRWADHNWWKWWSLDSWLDHHPDIDTVVWCDDHLSRGLFAFHDDYDVETGGALTRATYVRVELERRGLRTLIVAPATNVGLTPGDVARIETFLGGPDAPATPLKLPREPERPRFVPARHDGESWESRRCSTCDEDAWYLRYAPVFIDCTACHRMFYGMHDITDLVSRGQSHDRS